MEKKDNDNVNHPKHYTFGKYEVIDVIEDWELGYHLGNAVKYIARAGKKNKDKIKEDLEKSIWYIERYISMYGKEMWIDVDEKFLNLEEGDRVRNRLSKNDYIVTRVKTYFSPESFDPSYQDVIVGGKKGEEVELNNASEWEKYNGIFPRDFDSGKKKEGFRRVMCLNDLEPGKWLRPFGSNEEYFVVQRRHKDCINFEVQLRSAVKYEFWKLAMDILDENWEVKV